MYLKKVFNILENPEVLILLFNSLKILFQRKEWGPGGVM